MQRTILTVEYINSHIGEIIDWFCFGYSGNLPYSGKCKLIGMAPNEKRDNRLQPVIEHISGTDKLSGAWVDYDGKTLTYSDGGREVYVGKEFEHYTLQWEVPTMHMFFSDDTCMNYSVIVYLKEDSETLLSKIARKTNARKVRVKETGDIYMRGEDGKYTPVLTIL